MTTCTCNAAVNALMKAMIWIRYCRTFLRCLMPIPGWKGGATSFYSVLRKSMNAARNWRRRCGFIAIAAMPVRVCARYGYWKRVRRWRKHWPWLNAQ
ncbi:hypothetical protein D3C73_1444150 [compost metagenome]